MLTTDLWLPTRQTDPRAVALYRRHYSCRGLPSVDYRRHGIAGPGDTLTLLTPLADALWLWRRYLDDGGHQGVCCACFRNEGVCCACFRNESAYRSSTLITEACTLAWQRWPGQRLYTYVDPRKLPATTNPGYCFLRAGWTRLKQPTAGGLRVLEIRPT